jgi:hypothetical protein
MEPGGFVVPGGGPGAPGPTGLSAIPVRPGTVPPAGFMPPQVTYPQPTQPYAGVVPPVVPHGYRTPTPSESPVFPSPPSREGGGIFIPPDLPPARGSMGIPPQVYQPPIPEEELFIPPSPSRTPTSPPRSPSLIPVVPGPHIMPQQPAPPVLVYPPSQPSRVTRTPSSERSRTPPSPLPGFGFPSAGQPTIINIPQQPGLIPPAIPQTPSTQPPFDGRGEPPMLAPGMMPPVQFVPTGRGERSEPSDFERREPQQPGQQPIIIHPPAQTVTPGPFGPPIGPIGPGMPIVGEPRRSRSRTYSPSLTASRTPSPPRSFYGPSLPQPSGFPVPFPVGAPPVGFPPVGVGPMAGPAPHINIAPPSRGSPSYHSPTREGSPRLYPAPSRAASRYSDRGQPIPAMMPVPTAVHIEPSPYPSYRPGRSRYAGSRTPSSERDRDDSRERRRRRRGRRGSPDRSRAPSFESEETEPRRRSRYGSPTRYGSPSQVFPAPVGLGPGVGPTVLPPPAVTHVHTYPPRSPTGVSEPLTEREFEPEPLPHPYPPPTQYLPSDQVVVPGRAASGRTRASRAPTIVEVGPEPIRVHPAGHGPPRTESFRKCSMYPCITQRLLLIGFRSLSTSYIWTCV